MFVVLKEESLLKDLYNVRLNVFTISMLSDIPLRATVPEVLDSVVMEHLVPS
jgi:hypothetical protein